MNGPGDGDPASRRFGIGDGVILIIAVAIWLERFRAIRWFQFRSLTWCWQAVTYLVGLGYWDPALGRNRAEVMSRLPFELITLVLSTLCPVFLGLMVAQPLIRLRRPRPTMPEVVLQSGFVTCLIGLVLVAMLFSIGDMRFSGPALTLPLTRAITLLMLWPLVALPPWRAERSWVDRLGRAVGWGWILAMAGGVALEYHGWL